MYKIKNEPVDPSQYIVKFTGDFKELKKLGYSFQKLYAKNYMQWDNGDISIWKKGGDVTSTNFHNFFPAIVNFFLSKGVDDISYKKSYANADSFYGYIYVNPNNFECSFDKSHYLSDMKKVYRLIEEENSEKETADLLKNAWVQFVFTPESIQPLVELIERNLISVEKYH